MGSDQKKISLINIFSVLLMKGSKIRNMPSFRISEIKEDRYPLIQIQIINSRGSFLAKVHDLISNGDVQFFSTLDVVLITYIATLCEMESSNIEIPDIKVLGVKQNDHGRVYHVKNLHTGDLYYETASELVKSKSYFSLSKKEIDTISQAAGFERCEKIHEAKRIFENDIKIKISKIMMSFECVEILVFDCIDKTEKILDISEVLFKRNMMSKNDNYLAGKLEVINKTNSFGRRPLSQ